MQSPGILIQPDKGRPTLGQLRWATALTTLIALLASPLAAQEASDTVALTVRGVSGRALKAKRRHFLSVNVVLDNPSAADSEGVLRVYRVREANRVGPDQSLFYERRVQIPRQGRRVETLYYYCQENEPKNRLCVSYQPDGGDPSTPVFPQFEVLENEQMVLVLSSKTPSADASGRVLRAAVVPGPRRNYGTRVENAELGALPDHMAGYDSFDVVLVVDLDPADLPPEKAGPLLDWVSAGGDLVVTGSAGRTPVPPTLKAVLPVVPARSAGQSRRQLTGLRGMAPSARLPSPTPVLVERVEALSTADVLAGDSQGPLVVRGRHGAGTVTFVAFPFDAAPLRRWNGVSLFGSGLMRPPREDLEAREGFPTMPPVEEVLLNLSEAVESLEPPSALLVAPLLLLYVALVSPLNFFLLSKARKLNLAQGSAALVAVIFGGMFFGIGYLYKGSDALVTQVALIELPTRPGKSRVDVMTGYFSTDRGLTEATCPPGAVVGPVAITNTSREGRVIHEDGSMRLAALTLDTWALRRFRSLRAEDLGHLEMNLSLEGRPGRVRGTLVNRTQLNLETAVLLVDNGYVNLDTVGAGASVRVRNDVRWMGRDEVRIPLLGALYQDANRRYPAIFGEGVLATGDPYDGSAERRILATIQSRLARVPRSPGKVPALLVARVQSDPGGTVIAGDARATLARMLVFVETQIDVPPGPHLVRGLSPRVIRADLWQPTSGRTGASPLLKGSISNLTPDRPGYVEWRWQLPASKEGPVELETLHVNWRTDPRPVPLLQKLQAFNYRSGTWVPIQDMGKAKLDNRRNGRWPEEINPLVHDIVDPNTGTIYVRMLNHGQNVTIERIQLDARFVIASEPRKR